MFLISILLPYLGAAKVISLGYYENFTELDPARGSLWAERESE